MAADDVTDGPANRLDELVRPVYGPALAAGLLVQVVALVLVAVGLTAAGPALSVAGLVLGALVDLATYDEQDELRARLRRFGLGIVVRVLARALLLLATAAVAGAEPGVLVAYPLAVLALVAAMRVVSWAQGKVVQLAPATAERNLGEDLELHGFFGRLRQRRFLITGVLGVVEVPLAGALLLAVHVEPVLGLVALAVVTAGLLLEAALAARWVRGFLRSGAIRAYTRALRDEIAASGTEVVVYFSGDRLATYQLAQWMPVIERLERPVLLLLREAWHLEDLAPTRWPVVVAPRHRDVEVVLAADPRAVLYVANAGRNLHFLRYGRPRHVFLNHGDSDKASSANPVVKVYDKLFVAGEVGAERYRAAGIDLPDDRFALVGRPQLDHVLDGRRRSDDGPPTLLYAPTWEGFFDTADYSSLERSGEALIRHVLERRPDVRIVFKPHPASGTVRASAAAARQRVTALLREAGAPHVLAEDHPDLDLLAWFDRSDVLLADVSAVVTDFLHTDKPYLVTNPRGLTLDDFHAQFPSHVAAYVVAADLGDLADHLDAAFGHDPLAAERARMKRRVLGEHPDGPLASFHRALDDVVAEAERNAHRVVNTFAYDHD